MRVRVRDVLQDLQRSGRVKPSEDTQIIITLLLVILTRVDPSLGWRVVWTLLLIVHVAMPFLIARKRRKLADA